MGVQPYFIGTAGWSIDKRQGDHFSANGSHLERYASRLGAVEINSSFYKPHRRETYERWAGSVPDAFRFAVKIPKAITHNNALVNCAETLDEFLGQVLGLGDKLGVLLVQLPPGLRFDPETATSFLRLLRGRTESGIACEPRHASWFEPEVDALLKGLHVARVAADPALHRGADAPGGWPDLAYLRMHGSPRIYFSDYPVEALERVAAQLRVRPAGAEVWCIFDNTVKGHALDNALALDAILARKTGVQSG